VISIARSKNKDAVFAEIQSGWPQQAAAKNWTVKTFDFKPPADHWLLTLRTRSELKVDVKYVSPKGFTVYLLGTLEKGGGEAKTSVGNLPGS
jgi:hypothetical protein